MCAIPDRRFNLQRYESVDSKTKPSNFRRGHFEARNSNSKFENRKPEQDCSQKIDYPEQIFGKCEKEPKVRKGLPIDKNAV